MLDVAGARLIGQIANFTVPAHVDGVTVSGVTCGAIVLAGTAALIPAAQAGRMSVVRRAAGVANGLSVRKENEDVAVLPLCYRGDMAGRKKRSISMPPELDELIERAATQAGMSYSGWLAATARKEFIIQRGMNAVAEFEREHGAFTTDELDEADRWADGAVTRAKRSGGRQRKSA